MVGFCDCFVCVYFGYEVCDFVVGVVLDFRIGGFVVVVWIVWVFVLVWFECFGDFLC